jgi:hypothetical protein
MALPFFSLPSPFTVYRSPKFLRPALLYVRICSLVLGLLKIPIYVEGSRWSNGC